MTLKLSIVVATYNRGAALMRVLQDLDTQSLPPSEFEVIIVDDGSREPAERYLQNADVRAYALTSLRQENAGPAAARDVGIARAQGEIIVIIDDDMRFGPDFLAEHQASHEAGADVVLGYIAPPEHLDELPFFERFHADQLERFARGAEAGRVNVRGVHMCTGNVSFRRAAYHAVGGFDRSLGHSEDRELGVRFEKAGYKLVFNARAKTLHESDRASLEGWLTRSFKYGVYDTRIGKRHPELEIADPWRFLFQVHPVTRPFALAVVAAPALGPPLAATGIKLARALERAGLEGPAMKATTFSYGMQYFRGLRTESGSLVSALDGLRKYVGKRRKRGAS